MSSFNELGLPVPRRSRIRKSFVAQLSSIASSSETPTFVDIDESLTAIKFAKDLLVSAEHFLWEQFQSKVQFLHIKRLELKTKCKVIDLLISTADSMAFRNATEGLGEQDRLARLCRCERIKALNCKVEDLNSDQIRLSNEFGEMAITDKVLHDALAAILDSVKRLWQEAETQLHNCRKAEEDLTELHLKLFTSEVSASMALKMEAEMSEQHDARHNQQHDWFHRC